jgi:hypothetical protein
LRLDLVHHSPSKKKGDDVMQKHIPALVLFVGLMTLAVCFGAAAERLTPTNPGKFWTLITQTTPYTNWSHWPGYPGKYPGKSPHGAYLELYANDVALQAAKQGRDMPDGAILVKENYGRDQKTLLSITPMAKVKAYNPDAGDWFWAKYSTDGKVVAAGKVDSCINCHRSGKDYRFTTPR